LDLHVPAWVISRWIPIACLILASIGMCTLLLRLRYSLPTRVPITAVPSFDVIAAAAAGIFYACSSYTFTELAAGHWLYLIAIAAFPWSALILVSSRHAGIAIVGAGTLLAFAYVQVQFMAMAPIALVSLAVVVGSRRLAVRSLGAATVGFLPHIPWIVPLVAYPPSVDLSAYLLPGTDAKFSISPPDALRLVGYVTPFTELAVSSWLKWWLILSVGLVAVGAIGLMRFRAGPRAVITIAVGMTVLYQWGPDAPGYALWNRLIPNPGAALFRERYALSFLTLMALSLCTFTAIRPSAHVERALFLSRRRASRWTGQWLAGAIASLALLSSTAPFWDGHLGP